MIDTSDWKNLTNEVERHLDQDHWREYHEHHDFPCGRPTEFFWIAQNMPKRVSFHAIDADSKNCVGWIGEGTPDNPVTPVMEMGIDHFQNLKAIYDAFPDRIWCITSETLGLDIIERHRMRSSFEVHESTKRGLNRIGLGHVEVHPMSGRCKRRPFGEHYRTITSDNVLTTWQNQLDYFDNPGQTPSFRHIALTLIVALKNQWDDWLNNPYGHRNRGIDVPAEVDRLRTIARQVEEWLDAGCPSETRTIVSMSGQELNNEQEANNSGFTPQPFDYSVLRGGQWAKTLKDIARNGLPAEDSLGPIVFEMAKWLWWIELFDLPEPERHSRVMKLLIDFVSQKHNGMSSRINNGQLGDVNAQVLRCVVSASSLNVPYPDKSKQLFTRLRTKRESGKYLHLIKIVPVLEGQDLPEQLPIHENTTSLLSTLFSETTFEEKLTTPLPESLTEMIRPCSGRMKLDNFVKKFINLLYFARQDDDFIWLQRQELWDRELIPKNPKRWQRIVRFLINANVIDTDTYRAHTRPTGFRLTNIARDLIEQDRSGT
ncbi:MAG TPA: hypothetical protein DD473_22000 [Planctomycetaceae bacterium]|nr:hypothetical protein [Planctomycetaceae bacterium]